MPDSVTAMEEHVARRPSRPSVYHLRSAYRTDSFEEPVDVEKAKQEQAPVDITAASTTREVYPPEDEDEVVIKTTEEKLREAERVIASEVFYLNDVPEDFINLAAGACIFMFLQAVFLFLVAGRSDENYFWFTSYPDPEASDGGEFKPSLNEIASFSILWLNAVIPLSSALEHLTCIVFQKTYEWYLQRNQNVFRWTEYTFSASLMKIVIAMQFGITDIHILVCLFVLMALTIQNGASHENFNAKPRSEDRKQNWRSFFTSWIAFLTTWAIIFNYFGIYASRGGADTLSWTIVISQFFLDTSFAITFSLQWLKIGYFKDYVYGEKVFIVASTISKTLLVWTTVANVK